MKKIFLALLLISFGINFAQEDGAQLCSEGKIRAYEKLFKSARAMYPGDSNIDITYYKLNLTLQYSPQNISGVITAKLNPTQQISAFFLDLVNTLKVSSVTMNGKPLIFTQPANSNQVQIFFDKSYDKGEEISVDITYSGTPGTSGFGSFNFASHGSNQPIIWSLSEPYGAKDWWPSKDTPGDKADSSDVWITADQFYTSVSNGKLVGIIDNGNGTKTYKWHNSYPISTYLISIAMTNYQLYQTPFEYATGKTMPVDHYIYPENLTSSSKTQLDLTKDMLKFYSDKFGLYPFLKEKYGHAQFGWGGGMEHQTVTSLVSFQSSLIAHELAHQWYGDKITCKDWQNIWLNEGFATYCDKLYHQYALGNSTFTTQMNSVFSSARSAKGSIYVQDISSVNSIFDSPRSYNKGASVLHMLRGIVGDENFFQIMKEYASDPGVAYGVAVTEDFQRVCERVYGQSLEYFFKEWIYGENYPKYTLGWNYKIVNGSGQLTLRLTQNTNTNPQFFTMPVRIRITAQDVIINTTFMNDQKEQVLVYPINQTVTKVELDPDNWILKDVVATTRISEEEIIPSQFSLSQNYPNPFNPETKISYQLSAASYVTLKVYDLMGREIATLVDEMKQPGFYNSTLSILHYKLSSGVYFYTLKAGDFTETKKMQVIK